MRTPLALVTLLLAAAALSACGAAAGDSCNTTGYLCEDDRTALECGSGKKWRAIPCRGPGGCEVKSGKVVCDVTRNQAGDACASENEGEGICHPSGGAVLECRSGVFQQTRACSSCTVSNEQVVCTE